ncbi:MAG TPA: MaoC family dehydratase [Rhizobiaceae bacterium]|nr:MaoC family dehydratase [Rhizobiaceae bacterium]
MPGRYFEEFTPGEVIKHEITRTITEVDNILFSSLTINTQPLHIDYHFAAKSIHGKPLVNGMFTLSLMMGITVPETTLGTTEGNLGFSDITFPAPVFYGDTIRVETEVIETRPSSSRPGLGIVQLEHRAINQDGKVVVRCKRAGLMRGKAKANAV